jgi:hypothetical protein
LFSTQIFSPLIRGGPIFSIREVTGDEHGDELDEYGGR